MTHIFRARHLSLPLSLIMLGLFCSTFSHPSRSDTSSPRSHPASPGPRAPKAAPQTRSLPRPDPTQPCPSCPEPTRQTIYAPTIGMEEVAGSQIVLNNRSPNVMDTVPTFYTEEGEAIVGESIRLEPTEIRFVDIKKLIPPGHRGRHEWGGMSLSYTGHILEAWAQITLTGVGGSGSADVTFSVLDGRGSDVQEAAWWMPRKGTAVIALGNSSGAPLHTTVELTGGESEEVDIAPFGTRYVRVRAAVGGPPSEGTARAVRLTTVGAPGSLRAVGVVSSANYASSIRFYDPRAAVQQHLFATNLRLKDTLPRMVLRNTGDTEVTAQPRFRPVGGEGAGVFELPPLTLGAREVAEVDLGLLVSAAANRPDLDSVSVQVTNTGAPGSLIGALNARGRGAGTSYDVPLRDSGKDRNLTGSYPWRVDNDYTTVATITNVGDQPARFHVDVRYPGGSYYLAPRELAIGETATFDLRAMQAAQRPDHKGNKFPRKFSSGQFHWSVAPTPGHPKLVGRAEVVSRSKGVSSSYSCPTCCPDGGPFGGWLPGTSTLYVDGFAARTSSGDYYDCYWHITSGGTIAMSNAWTDDTAVASIASFIGDDPNLYGESTGGTYLVGEWGQTYYDTDGMDCYYRYYPASDSTGVEVQCQNPTGETTTSGGWDDADGLPTVHMWNVALTPSSISFIGRGVIESSPGGGQDNCWFSGSANDPNTEVTGTVWQVVAGNQFDIPDSVGWLPGAVNYYRQQGRAPCTAHFQQVMSIDCPSGSGVTPYATNTIEVGIGVLIVTSSRGGAQDSRTWP